MLSKRSWWDSEENSGPWLGYVDLNKVIFSLVCKALQFLSVVSYCQSQFYINEKNKSHRCSPKHQPYSQVTKAHWKRRICFIFREQKAICEPNSDQNPPSLSPYEKTNKKNKQSKNKKVKCPVRRDSKLKSWCVLDFLALRLISKVRFRRSKQFIRTVHKSWKHYQRDLRPPEVEK